MAANAARIAQWCVPYDCIGLAPASQLVSVSVSKRAMHAYSLDVGFHNRNTGHAFAVCWLVPAGRCMHNGDPHSHPRTNRGAASCPVLLAELRLCSLIGYLGPTLQVLQNCVMIGSPASMFHLTYSMSLNSVEPLRKETHLAHALHAARRGSLIGHRFHYWYSLCLG